MTPRPCECDRTESCRLCWLYHNDDRYRRLWSGRRQRWNWPRRALSFLRSFARHALAGFPTVNPIVKARRMALCMACEKFNSEKQSCRACGCKLKLKTSWALETCPLGRW